MMDVANMNPINDEFLIGEYFKEYYRLKQELQNHYQTIAKVMSENENEEVPLPDNDFTLAVAYADMMLVRDEMQYLSVLLAH